MVRPSDAAATFFDGALVSASASLAGPASSSGRIRATLPRALALIALVLPGTLLAQEGEGAAWRSLLEGPSLERWRGYQQDAMPKGWSLSEDGVLRFNPRERQGQADIVTADVFGDFEIRFDWKVGPGGNSGLFYFVTEDEIEPYWTGPEYQILDNEGHPDGKNPATSAGAVYGLYAPAADAVRAAGEWNEGRLVVEDGQVEHWLNGALVVRYDIGSEDWKERVAGSKFGKWPRFGAARLGRIGLQDHGDEVWFRKIRIRELN